MLVWDATVEIMRGLFSDVWGGRDVITVDHCVDITLPVRNLLLVICIASEMLYRSHFSLLALQVRSDVVCCCYMRLTYRRLRKDHLVERGHKDPAGTLDDI